MVALAVGCLLADALLHLVPLVGQAAFETSSLLEQARTFSLYKNIYIMKNMYIMKNEKNIYIMKMSKTMEILKLLNLLLHKNDQKIFSILTISL